VTKGGWGQRLMSLGLGLALAFGPVALAAPPGASKAPLVTSKQRAFRIPFNIDPADRPRYKQVQLWVSNEGRGPWEKVDTTTPDRPSFTFRASRDGEFWFAVRTVDTKGRLFPSDDEDVEPNMKVLVDTIPPQLRLEGLARRGSLASVRWEVIEDRLDLGSFLLEYQAVGASEWASVPIGKPARIGRETWDAGTAEPLKVRMTVADKAGNTKLMSLSLPDGLPRGNVNEPSDPTIPPPRSTFASSETERERTSPSPILSGPPPMPAVGAGGGPGADLTDSGSTTSSVNPFQANDPPPKGKPFSVEKPDPANPPIQVASPRFGLKYEIDDAGPNGPAAVELFVTNDGGRTWFTKGKDPDRVSPFPVDLGGEGTFGLKLVAMSAANQGDQPPNPGEVPRTIIEVDGTPPVVRLESVKVAGSKAYITWQANDPHLAPRPVMISVRGDTPGSDWQTITPTPIENTGQLTWTIPASCPPRVHFRVDVVDTLGNRGIAETPESDPVLVDRTRPRSRITGFEPNRREGSGPTTKPIP